MILALTEFGGLKGLNGEDLASFCRLPRSRVEALARALEEEGRPHPRLLAPSSRLPGQPGFPARPDRRLPRPLSQGPSRPARRAPREAREAVRRAPDGPRPGPPPPGQGGAGRRGVRDRPPSRFPHPPLGRRRRDPGRARRHGPQRRARQRDLGRPPGEVQAHARPKLQTLLAALAERKKIVEGFDGFILHSRWLDEIVRKIRGSGKRELTVADFKAMTGLSRKYSIPLLELLDSYGRNAQKRLVRDIL